MKLVAKCLPVSQKPKISTAEPSRLAATPSTNSPDRMVMQHDGNLIL